MTTITIPDFDPAQAIYIILDGTDGCWVLPLSRELSSCYYEMDINYLREICHILHPDRPVVTTRMPIPLYDVMEAQDEEDMQDVREELPLPAEITAPVEEDCEGDLLKRLISIDPHIFGSEAWRGFVEEVWEPHGQEPDTIYV